MASKQFYVTSDLHASHGQRFLNYLIDFGIQFILSMGFGFLAYFIGELTNFYALYDWIQNMNGIEEYLFGGVVLLFYYGLTETLFSRSLAKFITQTIVVDEEGLKPTPNQILKRTLCRFIPFDGLSFLGSNARGWHDSISDTYVVRKADFDKAIEIHNSIDEIGKPQDELQNEFSSNNF